MKKIYKMLFGLLLVGGLVGCSTTPTTSAINVVSREDGSGTRGAFIELFGVEEKNDAGEKVDNTLDTAEITNSTSVMLSTVEGNKNAIGYISLGSLNDSVKAVLVDGAEPTAENIRNGSYKISRPFNIATKDEINEQSQDFINFILSKEGQAVVEEKGYIPINTTTSYTSNNLTGKIVVAGSSSVTPVMEALKEAYLALNTGMTIEIQQSDSTSGVTAAVEGVCDIAMVSRELKDSELESGLEPITIAIDGIAIIINKENSITDLTSDQVKQIYVGEITSWEEIK